MIWRCLRAPPSDSKPDQRTYRNVFRQRQERSLIDKLSPLVIERGFTSYLDYYYLLKYDTAANAEWQNVMNALSVQETYFWREIDQVRRSGPNTGAAVARSKPRFDFANLERSLRHRRGAVDDRHRIERSRMV